MDILWFYDLYLEYQGAAQSLAPQIQASDRRTNLLKIILDSHLSNFVSGSARVKFVEVRYHIQARTPAASPTRGPTVAHISIDPYIPSLLRMVHF